MFGKNAFLRSWPCQFLTTLLLITGVTVSAAPPAWWSQVGADGHTVIDSTATDPNPKGPANIGQAKFMAKRALESLRAIAPGTATNIETDLVGPGKIIPTWDVPASGSAAAQAQRSPLRVGQLKAIAAPFYQHLHALDSEWLETQLETNQTKDSADPANYYPWTTAIADDANRAIATIGQLKAVFSLGFESLDPNRDSDGDGLTNVEEIAFGSDPNQSNSDGDGLTDAQEKFFGTNPNAADSQGMVNGTIENGDFSKSGSGSGSSHEPGWDYWNKIPGWTAVNGSNIELQTIWPIAPKKPEDPVNQYCELKAHPSNNSGITQLVPTVPGRTYTLAIDCRVRPDVDSNQSVIAVRIDNDSYNLKTITPTADWTTQTVVFTATKDGTDIALLPVNNPDNTVGCLVDNVTLVSMEFYFENDSSKSGKVIPVDLNSLKDADGVPNDTDGLVDIAVKASGFLASDKIKFEYSGSDPQLTSTSTNGGIVTYTNAPGAIRLWKKPASGPPTSQAAYIKPGYEYTLSELGITPGTAKSFYVQGVADELTKTSIEVEISAEDVIVEDSVEATILPIDILEVYSDQIAGNLANKLPTAIYRGESNNPMLMACRTSTRGYLDVRVNVPASWASSVLVGARRVGGDGSWLPLSYPAVSAPNPTRIQFNVSYKGSSNFYEVVAGFDANANGVLGSSEINVIFSKTPKIDKDKHPVTVDESIYDKIKVVTESEWVDSRLECLVNNVWGTDYTGDLISAFAHGQSTVDEGITTSPVTIISTQPGISHPVGARWNSSNSASTHKILFADGTEASDDVEDSNAIGQIIEDRITANLAAIKAATPNNGQWSNGGTYAFNESKPLIDTESEWVGINELGYAFGKVTFIGTMTVSSRWTTGGKLEIGSVTFNGGFTDLYDFSYWGGNRAHFASKVQAGHATLTNSSEPDAGKIFFTEVQFNGLRDVSKEY